MKVQRSLKQIIILFILFAIMIPFLMPLKVHADEKELKTVRVGWYESSFCYFDEYGRRNGIAYEYQQRIAAYTGWKYEYVEDSWPNLLQMLKDGEIDLLSDVSYTDERAGEMLFPTLPMGAESYYVYIDSDNREINPDNLQSFSGKKIGVYENSIQEGILNTWLKKTGINAEVILLNINEPAIMKKLSAGELDAYVTLNSFGSKEQITPVCTIGASEYYFAVNKKRPDLLADLNNALTEIQDEDPYYNQRIFDMYVKLTRTNAFLTPKQEEWIAKHGQIKVGYCDNYLPFCGTDPETGEVTGALKDYLLRASNCMKNADIEFDPVPYESVEKALEAMKAGEVDCVFPVNFSTYDGEMMGIMMVPPVMKSEMNVLLRNDTNTGDILAKRLTITVEDGNPNYENFIKDNFTEWEIKKCFSRESCFRSVSTKEADGVIVSNYRAGVYEPLRLKYRLVSIPTTEMMGLSFAVNSDDPELYSVLNKITNLTDDNDMEYALVSYMFSDHRTTFLEFVEDNWLIVILFITSVFIVLVFLLNTRLKAERKLVMQQKEIEESLRRELEQKQQIRSVSELAYKDPLTGVKSKQAFAQYEENMNRGIENKEITEFAVVLFDLNDLKKVNDTKGHDAGDRYIKDGCKIICTCFKHSPVFRIGGDEFLTVLQNDDFMEKDRLMREFEQKMEENRNSEDVTIAAGMAVFDSVKDTDFHEVVRHADKAMYQCKKQMKN